VTNSTFSGNSSYYGGGVSQGGTATVTNSTFSGNTATYQGGGLENYFATVTVTNSTFSGNSAFDGGGIKNLSGTATVNNTIVANSSAGGNCNGAIGGSNNLANDDTCGAGFANSSSIQLGALGSFGGSTQTFPLLPGSSAIDTGDSTVCSAAPVSSLDQRGVARPSACDIGAFESQGFTLTKTGGDNQTTPANTVFATPLGLTVTAKSAIEVVSGGQVTFTAPSSGASTNPAGFTAAIATGGVVSATATANSTVGGPYTVTASASGATSVSFSLTNAPPLVAPAITSVSATTFTVGLAGTFTVTTTGNPTATIGSTGTLPAGVTFVDNGNGTATLAGTPGAGTGGTYPLTITASNGVLPNATQSFTLTVNQAPAITSVSATTFTVGSAGTFTITTTGNPSTTIGSTGTLPVGVTFVDNSNGTATLGGTPAYGGGGVYTLTITASNGVTPQATQTFTLTISSVMTFSGTTATGTGTATASISGGGPACTFLGDAAFISASSVSVPAPVQFPQGLFTFTLRGCLGQVTMTLTYPSVLPLGSAYWKYGPASKQATPTWYTFVPAPAAATKTYTLMLANNTLGDDDWDTTPDIVDQGGPGAPAEAIPTLGDAGLALLACLLAVAGFVALRRMGC